MRLAIDLQACQHGAAADPEATVALVRALVTAAQAAGHTVLLMLYHAWPAQADDLRRAPGWPSATAPAIPSAAAAPGQVQLHVLATTRGGDDWRRGAADLLRATVLQDWRADLVWTPGLFERDSPHAVTGTGTVPAIYSLGSMSSLRGMGSMGSMGRPDSVSGPAARNMALAASERQHQALARARLLTGADAATVAALRLAAPGVEVVQAASGEAMLAALTGLMAAGGKSAVAAHMATVATVPADSTNASSDIATATGAGAVGAGAAAVAADTVSAGGTASATSAGAGGAGAAVDRAAARDAATAADTVATGGAASATGAGAGGAGAAVDPAAAGGAASAAAGRAVTTAATHVPIAARPARPSMAFLSPLPPQHSGIADYSVELLAQLERYYDIELIADDPVDPGLARRYPVRDCAWFDRHAGRYARVLYHFGNHSVHQHMFALLRRHPGIVVLHDFFLSGALDQMERSGQPQVFLDALYASHGHTGLLAHQRHGRHAAIWTYPCNRQVLEHASGVIVHADFSRRLAQQWYGGDSAQLWQTVPLIRGLPAGHDADSARATARAALGVADDVFLVCSFGMMGVTKRNELLLAAFLASPLAADPRCQLVFVGAPDPGDYGRSIAQAIAAAGSDTGARIRITGFVAGDQYARWLAAADAAVQLRSRTRGETSASVLDCLLHGVPTVVNAHGANADLPADVLLRLPDDCDAAALAGALAQLHGPSGAALRAGLATRARAYMAAHHAPSRVGPRFRDAIETATAYSPAVHYAALLAALQALGPAPAGALMETAEAIAANRLPLAPRQLFVDISALVEADLKTGIQRVVRAIVLRLVEAPPPGYRVEPVYCNGGNRPYRYARSFTLRMLGCPTMALEDAPLEVRAGDRFLGLDLYTNGTAQNRERLQDMRRRGVDIYFVVYDLLPLLKPQVFPVGTDTYFSAYLDTIAAVADGVLCISRAVADELHDWLATRPGRSRREPLPLGYFHLGADLDASAPTTGLPANAGDLLDAVAARPSMLLVGTLEPRKCQDQALAAAELLWRQGVDLNLVIVGKQGWMVDKLVQQLQNHVERDRRLFWLTGASDDMLNRLYQSCSALLAPSIGEGFGLPLIEAARHGLPIIARDLPVFREVGGAHAYYFSGTAASDLAAALQHWLTLHAAGAAPPSSALPWLSWQASTEQLLRVLDGGHWYRTLVPAAAREPSTLTTGAA
ncbi:hypothetical protein ASF61_11465 [Duganella sp. Leaf126]|uniref:glycosyltransferase n=1 Tax=Duganella sp. Leaf126 TaxID=1736266 RepID=UPI0007018913|nr:glycosyltransferase [Duganella sp. Leaf126]KQQ33669.1 hypothetical protein ASF61_11465 [Duganella sp. Leaf126]